MTDHQEALRACSDCENRSRKFAKEGDVHVANGLQQRAKAAYRVADSVLRTCDHEQQFAETDWQAEATAWMKMATKYEAALHRIASMPYEPRPDGSYNYDRNALVQMARTALGRDDA